MPDTDAARTDMRFAQKYLENKQFDEAREYVISARRKDPNVTLAVKTESKTVAELTPNSLEADILVQQSADYAQQIDKVHAEKDKTYADSVKVHDRQDERWRKLPDTPRPTWKSSTDKASKTSTIMRFIRNVCGIFMVASII